MAAQQPRQVMSGAGMRARIQDALQKRGLEMAFEFLGVASKYATQMAMTDTIRDTET
jgi:hypothetical protein